jgi:hypothetical protein
MKIFPNLGRNYRIDTCICGQAHEVIKVNKNSYYNTILLMSVGIVCVIALPILSLYAHFGGREWLIWAVVAVFVVYLARNVLVSIRQGHNIVCAIRRSIISIAR